MQRKGQKLINYFTVKLIREGYEPSIRNIEIEIYNMSDQEFDKVINEED